MSPIAAGRPAELGGSGRCTPHTLTAVWAPRPWLITTPRLKRKDLPSPPLALSGSIIPRNSAQKATLPTWNSVSLRSRFYGTPRRGALASSSKTPICFRGCAPRKSDRRRATSHPQERKPLNDGPSSSALFDPPRTFLQSPRSRDSGSRLMRAILLEGYPRFDGRCPLGSADGFAAALWTVLSLAEGARAPRQRQTAGWMCSGRPA